MAGHRTEHQMLQLKTAMDKPADLLKKYWGYDSFLPHQKEIIDSVLEGHDTLAIMATGSGKSLCYQLPALYWNGLAIVISPLISLMKDQVDDLNARGIPAAAFTSLLEYDDRKNLEADLKNNRIRLLFLSPEKCVQPDFLTFIKKFPVCLFAIDEAHCISEWGHNFRPEYRQLSALKKHFPSVPLIALTATAIPAVRKDISRQLGLSAPRECIGSFNRKNLQYRILQKNDAFSTILAYVRQHRDESGIIYCLSKKETEEIAEKLRKSGFQARAYHAGLSKKVREDVQDAFIHDNAAVICATVAFGMGIDKPDVRFVIHYDMPKSLESYFQETGRAGRDGGNSECILFYSRGDMVKIRSLLEHGGADDRFVRQALHKLQAMADYCESSSCRRKLLLSYFGEEYTEENCGSCDNCDHIRETIDGTAVAKKIVACVRQLPSPYGVALIADVMNGAKNSRVRQYHLDSLPAYATGTEFSRSQIRTWIGELIRQGYLARTGDTYPVIRLTQKSHSIGVGDTPVKLSAPEQGTMKTPLPAVQSVTTTSEETLFLLLKTLRKSLAGHAGVPPFLIFPDTSLREMAQTKPCELHTFRNIRGVGEMKLEKYGQDFTSVIKTFCAANEMK